MHWDVVEVAPTGNRTLLVKFADGLTGTIRLDLSYCTGIFSPLLDDKLINQATVKHGAVTCQTDWIWHRTPCTRKSAKTRTDTMKSASKNRHKRKQQPDCACTLGIENL